MTTAHGRQPVKDYAVTLYSIHCVQKKTPTHIFFLISMSDV